MGFYNNFCGKGEQRQFLVIVNKHGEMGVAALDENGKPMSWAFGGTGVTVQSMLREVYPEATVKLHGYQSIMHATDCEVSTPEECCDVLNGKQSAKRRLLQFMVRFTTRLEKFIEYDHKTNQYIPNEIAIP